MKHISSRELGRWKPVDIINPMEPLSTCMSALTTNEG